MLKPTELLQPTKLNSTISLQNKIVMAPMTRAHALTDGTPSKDMVQYYAKRADAGLIVTEGAIISESATGYANVPGIHTTKHVEAWKKVTDAVHEKGGVIFLQIWHVGRVSHPSFLGGELPISASATRMQGRIRRSTGLYYGQSRQATLDEIRTVINQFANATTNAIQAGFDGVEIHGANGYLIDQFLHYDTNKRTDQYGDTPNNMAQFAIDIVDACIEKASAQRVGIRLSPGAYLNEIEGDNRDALVFKRLLEVLSTKNIAYVHTGNFDDSVTFRELDNKTMTAFIRENYNGRVIACGGYTVDTAENHIMNKDFDLVALGKPFIANPDLIQRLRDNIDLVDYQVSMLDSLN